MDNKRMTLNEFGKALEDELDFDFSVSEKRIESLDEFDKELMARFNSGEGRIFYRGERINDISRPLVPTILRNRKELLKNGERFINITSDFLIDYYKSNGNCFGFYNSTFGKAGKYRLYEFCAFSQHYYNSSPLIDFSKSLYVAMSFALKGRAVFDDDCVIYTVEISDNDSYTTDPVTAECWLNDLKITIYNTLDERMKPRIITPELFKEMRESADARAKAASPKAKLIDIPTNDLMKFQKGVFLLLTDYSLVYRSYLTKNIRNDFKVTKYIISKDICPALVKTVSRDAPWYEYDSLLDVKKEIKKVLDLGYDGV